MGMGRRACVCSCRARRCPQAPRDQAWAADKMWPRVIKAGAGGRTHTPAPKGWRCCPSREFRAVGANCTGTAQDRRGQPARFSRAVQGWGPPLPGSSPPLPCTACKAEQAPCTGPRRHSLHLGHPLGLRGPGCCRLGGDRLHAHDSCHGLGQDVARAGPGGPQPGTAPLRLWLDVHAGHCTWRSAGGLGGGRRQCVIEVWIGPRWACRWLGARVMGRRRQDAHGGCRFPTGGHQIIGFT